jgi:hypothetical protein
MLEPEDTDENSDATSDEVEDIEDDLPGDNMNPYLAQEMKRLGG